MHDDSDDDDEAGFLLATRDDPDMDFALDDDFDLEQFRIDHDLRVEAAYTARRSLRCAGVRAGADQLMALEEESLAAAVRWAEAPADRRGPMPGLLAMALVLYPDERRCRLCGCTDEYACEHGCTRHDATLCSACVPSPVPHEVYEVCRLRDPVEPGGYGVEPVCSTWDLGHLMSTGALGPGPYRVMMFDRRSGARGERADVGGFAVRLDGLWGDLS